MSQPELVVERLERDAGDLLVGRTRRQAAHHVLQRLQQIDGPRLLGGRHAEAGDALDVVDVGAAQPEHVAHPRLRRDRIEVGPHRLERLAVGLGVQVAQVERVLLAGSGSTTITCAYGFSSRFAFDLLRNCREIATRSAST